MQSSEITVDGQQLDEQLVDKNDKNEFK